MGRTACTEPQCLYKGALYLYLLLNIICVLIFSARFVWNIPDCERKRERTAVTTVHKSSCTIHAIAGRFHSKLNFSTDLGKILKYRISWTEVHWEPSCSMPADRRTNTNKLIVAFRSCTKAPTNPVPAAQSTRSFCITVNTLLLYYSPHAPSILQSTRSFCITVHTLLLYYSQHAPSVLQSTRSFYISQHAPSVLQSTRSFCITGNKLLLYYSQYAPSVLQSTRSSCISQHAPSVLQSTRSFCITVNTLLLCYSQHAPSVLQSTRSFCITGNTLLLYYSQHAPSVVQSTRSFCITVNTLLL